MVTGWFRYVYALLGVIATAAVAGFLLFLHTDTRTITTQVPQPPPTSSESVDSMIVRLGKPAGTVPGSQINPQLPGSCDVYQGGSWILLFCH